MYAELAALSNFSFLKGASHPDEIVLTAARLGHRGVAVADENTLAGIVRGHSAAKKANIRYVVAARLKFICGAPDLLVYPSERAAYGRLCRLLTRGKRAAAKGDCALTLEDAIEFGDGQLFAAAPGDAAHPGAVLALEKLKSAFPKSLWLAASPAFAGEDRARLNRLARQAEKTQAPLLATNNVLYHDPLRRPLQDILHCIRTHVTLDEAGRALEANAERHLKAPEEMARLFADHPYAIEETTRLLDRARFSLDELRYEYPDEARDGRTPQEELELIAAAGARERYPTGMPKKVAAAVEHELKLIAELSYAPYFLTVHDIVRAARERGILCQGRGSAANSAVCFCLGITSVDPSKIDLLFERFISAERGEPPDIDVDFEHERREEVIQHIYRKYGRERAGIAATVITYRTRSAVREVGKAMGLSEDMISGLAKTSWGIVDDGVDRRQVAELGLNPDDAAIRRTLALTRELLGFPRHLSQHTGGFVITRGALDEVIPIGNAAMDERTFVEWDKDDLDALGIIKVDVLGLGMLTCIAKSFALLRAHYGIDLDLAGIPPEEPEVYDMICRADTIGVFQIESRAQMSMLPRLKPRKFYDLVIEVAIVRPGPIQGDMVHPYLRRRRGEEKADYPSPELEAVLGKTLGVPLFQEQAMKIAIVAGGFTPSEADQLRRAMATFRKAGTIQEFGRKLIDGMTARGYEPSFAERCFKQIEGFGEYGFPESHAASFALLVYVSCWLKCHYPDVFAAALLNSQPMGFYAPAQIVRDAREHGVEILSVDVNLSDFDCTLERDERSGGFFPQVHPRHQSMRKDIRTAHAVRLGFRQIKGLPEDEARTIMAARSRQPATGNRQSAEAPWMINSVNALWNDAFKLSALTVAGCRLPVAEPFDSIREFWLRTRLPRATLERLADADAFGSLGLSRRDALWAVKGLDPVRGDDILPLFGHEADIQHEEEAALPAMPLGEEVAYDYKTLRLSLKAHPVRFLREKLADAGYRRNEEIAGVRNGAMVKLSGLVLIRQRPGSAKGVIFATLEDETGVANIIIWPKTFERYRRIVLSARFLGVCGKLQREGEVIHIVAETLTDLTPALARLSDYHGEMDAALARADEVARPLADARGVSQVRRAAVKTRMDAILPKGRNFH
ncbi:MAG: error-prone DNA polymerase [Parvularculaceae bacterium]